MLFVLNTKHENVKSDIVGSALMSKYFIEVLNWVNIECGGHGNGAGEKGRPVLLHPVFENDAYQVDAHSIHSFWLGGRTTPVNLKFLKQFEQ